MQPLGVLEQTLFVYLNNMGIGIYLILILLGLVIGSFVSVITYRVPRGLQFVKGKSFCDKCKKELKWYDNIPLFSFLYYRGRSRCCDKKISPRYPLIELASAFGFVTLYLFSLPVIYYLLFTSSLVILIIDFEYQIIPDELTWLVLFLGLANSQQPMTALFPAFLFSILFLFLYLVTRGRGMGLGDVKLAIPLGLWLGLERGLTWFATSFIIGGIFATILLLLKRAKLKTKIAFGPFMILAFWIVLLWK